MIRRDIRRRWKGVFNTKPESDMNENQDPEIMVSTSNLARGFACPYPGSSFGSCQDGLYADPDNGFFSVVDGVSEGMGQSYYVMLLTRYNSDSDNIRITTSDAADIHKEWKEYQEALITDGRMPRNSLRLYQEGKYAHATYIRMKFYLGDPKDNNIRWKSAVLGDSALLHVHRSSDGLKIKHVMMSNENVRADKYIYSDTSGYYDFSQDPDQLDESGTWLENEAYMEGEFCEAGDVFLLTTDHVAAWILGDASNSINRINQLLMVQTQEEFQKLIDKEREENPETGCQNMGDDDSTALIVEIQDPKNLDFKVTSMTDPRKKYEEEKNQNKAILETKLNPKDNDESLGKIESYPQNQI